MGTGATETHEYVNEFHMACGPPIGNENPVRVGAYDQPGVDGKRSFALWMK